MTRPWLWMSFLALLTLNTLQWTLDSVGHPLRSGDELLFDVWYICFSTLYAIEVIDDIFNIREQTRPGTVTR